MSIESESEAVNLISLSLAQSAFTLWTRLQWPPFNKTNVTCECGEADHTMEHCLVCPLLPNSCSSKDLAVFNKKCKGLCGEVGGCHINHHASKKRKEEQNKSFIRHLAVSPFVHFPEPRADNNNTTTTTPQYPSKNNISPFSSTRQHNRKQEVVVLMLLLPYRSEAGVRRE